MSVDTIDVNVNDNLPVEIDVDVSSAVSSIDVMVDPLDLSSEINDLQDQIDALSLGTGVPLGGTTGQALRKTTNADLDTYWDTLTASDVGADPSGSAAAVQTNLNTEASTRATADTTLQTNIDNEATARANADSAHTAAVDPHPQYETSTEVNSKITTHSGATDPHGDRAFTTSSISTHAGATDPHGDRAYADSAVSTHSADTTAVHGIADTSVLETTTGAQSKVDTHSSDTTNIHGIVNTANLILEGDSRLTDARTPTTHGHDDLYYTEGEVNTLLSGKADTHSHPYEASGAVSTHEGASDPHTGYQKETEKGAANGYASLDAGTKVPVAQLPTGSGASEVSLGNHTHPSNAAAMAIVLGG